MATEIVMKEKAPDNPVVIEGFPSKGFVSTIATKYMIDDLGMRVIGHVSSDRLRSIAIIHDSEPLHPIRIYAKDDLVLIFSEIIIPIKHMHEISGVVAEWLGEIKPREVLMLAGISGKVTEKEHDILGLATTDELKEVLDKAEVSPVEEGMLSGISSDLLLYCFENRIPAISLMAETEYNPDPMAAVSMLRVLNRILGLDIKTDRIEKEGKDIEKLFKKVTEELKRSRDSHRVIEEERSPMYG